MSNTHKARIIANAPTDYAGQQSFAMTYTLLIVHGSDDMDNISPRDNWGTKHSQTSSFPIRQSRSVLQRGPVSSHPGWTSNKYTYKMRGVRTRKLLPSHQKDRSKSRPHAAPVAARQRQQGSSSKQKHTPCAHSSGTTRAHTIERRGFPAGLVSFLGGLRRQRRRSVTSHSPAGGAQQTACWLGPHAGGDSWIIRCLHDDCVSEPGSFLFLVNSPALVA